MQSMRRFFCAWMDLKAGHTIQILRVGADRRVRPRCCFSKVLTHRVKNLCVGEGCHALPQLSTDYEYAINTKRIMASKIHKRLSVLF